MSAKGTSRDRLGRRVSANILRARCIYGCGFYEPEVSAFTRESAGANIIQAMLVRTYSSYTYVYRTTSGIERQKIPVK